ncbi:hypothetical protein ARALYDRAFT_903311 [Arabidopsis lyrata subsp. lyrata]|uniref:Uncharacterized protein n=1 Tax=Arabidopsis lyrata subsp. lyrata TaxID=81972 RepID=D7LEI3_ARALL|nr:hypothetical protein ARALYDRAFT_903311 [Arabidopsis lyrata subsp. lyrata]
MITGKLPESVNKLDSVDRGLVDFLIGETLWPTLESYNKKIENARSHGWLWEITANDATSKFSPLWWPELEVLSTA